MTKSNFKIKGIDSYIGGKSGTGTPQAIINQVPDFDYYYELFLGNGALIRHLNFHQYEQIGLNDIDSDLIDLWLGSELPRNIKEARFSSVDAFLILREFIESKVRFARKTFIFLDPPYLIDTRKQKRALYENELTEDQHEELLDLIKQMKCNVMITHYPCEFYDSRLADWRKVDFVSSTRGGKVTERMYMNYAEPARLKDTSHIGKDYRERERIKKKRARHVAHFERLPLHEQQAMFDEMQMIHSLAKAAHILNHIDESNN